MVDMAIRKEKSSRNLEAIASALSGATKSRRGRTPVDLKNDVKVDEMITEKIRAILGKNKNENDKKEMDRRFDNVFSEIAKVKHHLVQEIKSKLTLFEYKFSEGHKT